MAEKSKYVSSLFAAVGTLNTPIVNSTVAYYLLLTVNCANLKSL